MTQETEPSQFHHPGGAIRKLRRDRRITQRELGSLAGVTASFVSQLERGLVGVDPRTEAKIKAALGVEHKWNDYLSPWSVVRSHERKTLSEADTYRSTHVAWNTSADITVVALKCEPASDTTKQATVSLLSCFLLALQGKALMEIGIDAFPLSRDDCIEFASTMPIKIINTGETVFEALCLTTGLKFLGQ